MFDDPECFIGNKPGNGVEIQRNMVIESLENSKHYPHFVYRYANHQAQWMRLTLHPRDMGLQGFEELHSILGMFTDDGWGDFSSEAKVTQIEVSIDLEGISLNSVNILPGQAKTVSVYKSGQKFETVYLGKSKSNQTIIYDRGAKRKQKGQEFKAGICTRIERKKSNLNLKVYELAKLKNPFSHVEFVAIPPVPPPNEKKTYIWELFVEAVAYRGLDPALKLLPQNKRSAYRKHIATHKHQWWLPDIIWFAWPGVLKELKLSDPSYWK
ncbi:hypothetical protein [uncultured Sulfitobacter sp.]|uniref:hypothetical protein n=1 Tax=uncultured Sulfitobacter sp. TaxID=191468 RepID=UPI002622BC3E|nr:hypothetical protein [uncultured Sulfitobacter sp.]